MTVVNIATLRLAVRSIFSALFRAFIGHNPAPFQRFHNIIFRTFHLTRSVGIFNSQNEIAALIFSKKIIIQGRSYATKMQRPGRAGCKTHSYFVHT